MPFRYAFTPRARVSIDAAQDYVEPFGEEASLRFANALQEAILAVCEMAGGEPTMHRPADETGSIAFSRPVYLRVFTTAKTRQRRSNAGTWRLYYTLADADGDGQADTIQVLFVSHAAAQPLTAWLSEGE